MKRDKNYRSFNSETVYILSILHLGFKNLKAFAAIMYGFSSLLHQHFQKLGCSQRIFFLSEVPKQMAPVSKVL